MSHMVRQDILHHLRHQFERRFFDAFGRAHEWNRLWQERAKPAQNQSRHMRGHREDDTISPDQGVGQVAGGG